MSILSNILKDVSASPTGNNVFTCGGTRITRYDAIYGAYNFAGSLIWRKTVAGTGSDTCNAVQSSPDGNFVYFAGETFSTTFDGQSRSTVSGYSDGYVAKYYGSYATKIWLTFIGTTSTYEECHDISISPNGNTLYVVGYTTSNSLNGQVGFGGSDDIFVVTMTASSGTITNTKIIGGAGQDLAYGCALSPDGNSLYVAATAYSSSINGVSFNGRISFVTKLQTNNNMNTAWTSLIGNSSGDLILQAVSVSPNGLGVFVSGYSYGTQYGFNNQGSSDIFTARLSANDGSVTWAYCIGTVNDDESTGIVSAPDNIGAYISGYTSGTLPGQTSAGSDDGILIKVSQSASDFPLIYIMPIVVSVVVIGGALFLYHRSNKYAKQVYELQKTNENIKNNTTIIM